MNQKRDLIYITETSLPTKSANIINSLKFCESLSNFFNVKILIPNNSLEINKIRKFYNLKKKFQIINLINQNIESFKIRFIFCLKVLFKLIFERKNTIIYGRSILSSMLLTLINRKNYLELHHTPNSFSKLFFKFILLLPQKKKLNLILINKSLVNELKLIGINFIILDDGADFLNFKFNQSIKYKKNTCIYIGSFYEGKGIEIIKKLAKMMPDIKFDLYGDLKTIKSKFNFNCYPNIKFYDYVAYKNIPEILKNYEVALMPYKNKILARSKNLEISKYISPLKMFDYLSAGKIILATNLPAYSHILKNNQNSFLLSSKNIFLWKKIIKKIFNNPKKFNKIKINARNTEKKYSWDNRAKVFYRFVET